MLHCKMTGEMKTFTFCATEVGRIGATVSGEGCWVSTTIKDVALAAGVSVATVSRAMNGQANVSPETSARILAVMQQLRYSPHGAAQSLVTRRTQTIGVLLPDMHGEFFSELIRGIDTAARMRRLHLLLSSSHGDLADTTAALKAMRGRVDGLIVMAPTATAQFFHDFLPDTPPAVLINAGTDSGSHIRVRIDNHGGAVEMVKHLHRLGRRRIVFVSGPHDNYDAKERLRGYRETVANLGLDYAPVVVHGDFSEPSGIRAGMQIAALADRPDAVFAANDMMAIGCLNALAEAGIRVPEDMAVVGYDDIPIARLIRPALTTVAVPIVDLGTAAVDRLLPAMEGTGAAGGQETVLRTHIRVRTSCGSVRSTVRLLRSGDFVAGTG